MPSYTRRVDVPGKNAQELYNTISADIERFLGKASLGNFNLDRKPEKNEIVLKSSMFSATLVCKDGCVTLDGQLSFLASPFKPKIDEGIDRWLTKTFGIKRS